VDEGAVRRPPGPADPVERLLREWPELGVFGADWLRRWAPYARERIAGMARVLRRYPWMAELIGRGPVGLIGPYSVEAYAGGTGRRPAYRYSAGPTAPRMGVTLRGWSWSSRAWSPMKAGWGRCTGLRGGRYSRRRRNTYGSCEARASRGLGVRGPAGMKPLFFPSPLFSPAG